MKHLVLVMKRSELVVADNRLIDALNNGYEIINSTPIVDVVSTGGQYSTRERDGHAVYVLRKVDNKQWVDHTPHYVNGDPI